MIMPQEILTGAESEAVIQDKTDKQMIALLERIRKGELPQDLTTLDEYLRYVATETTHDSNKLKTDDDIAIEKEFKRLKGLAAKQGVTDELIAQHQLLEDLYVDLENNLQNYSGISAAMTPEDISRLLEQQTGQAINIKKMTFPILKLLSFFKNSRYLDKIASAENILGLGSLGKMLLSRLPEETLVFLQETGKEKFSIIELIQLAPFLIEIIKRPNYLQFDPSIKPESVDLSKDGEFVVANTKPQIGDAVIRKIAKGTLESDLIILYAQYPELAGRIKDILARSSMTTKQVQNGKPVYGFNITPANMPIKFENINKVAQKLKGLLDAKQKSPTESQTTLDADPYGMGPTVQEKRTISSIVEIIKQKRNALENSTSPDQRSMGQKEDIEMWSLAEKFISSSLNMKEFVDDFYSPLYSNISDRVVLSHYLKIHPELISTGPVTLNDQIRAEVARNIGGEEKLSEEIAIETRNIIEKMLKHLAMTMYTDVIEAGGEPDVDFNTAVSKTVVGWSASAKQMINVLTKRLTAIKTSAASIAKNDDTTLILGLKFASPFRKKEEEYINDQGQRRQVLDVDVSHKVESSNVAFSDFASSLEIGFSTFNDAVEGSYSMRYWANMDGAKYFDYLDEPAAQHYINSKTFDLYHATAGSELTAQIVPTVKMIMLDFFNERGWIVGQELEEQVFGHKNTIYSQVNTFIQKNYPELSDSKRREVAYMAIHQAYAHFQFQQVLSRTRGTAGFQGKIYGDENAHFSPYRKGYSFAFNSASELAKHELWNRGAMMLPAWFDSSTGRWAQSSEPGEQKIENITYTAAYGALIEFGSRQFGHFLSYTDKHFDGTLPRSMMPYNILDGGSDDKLRGWRQINKVLGNVSTSLYERVSAKDAVALNSTYKKADQLTNIWKSVENVGINYIRSFMEEVGTMTYDAKTNGIKNEAKFEHLFKFLFNRYFVNTPQDGEALNRLRAHMLATIPELSGVPVGDASSFWTAVKANVIETKSADIANSILGRVYTMMIAERNPMTFMTLTTSWTTQSGETLWQSIKNKYSEDRANGFTDREGKLNLDTWNQTRGDLILIQSEARGIVTKRVKANRREWQNNKSYKTNFNKNIYGDFDADRSDVSVDGSTQGYVMTDKSIEQILRAKFGAEADIEDRIARAKRMYGDILTGMTETPDIPKYENVKKYMDSNLPGKTGAFGDVADEDKPDFEKLVKDKLGNNEAEYKQKYGNRMKNRSDWFVYLWQNEFLGIEPEADYAEDLTIYQNADENHIKRMANIVKLTTGEVKKVLSDPDNEHGLTEMIKNFAKDPIAAIDTMAGYLNKFRKVINRERGEDYSVRYLNWYVTTVVDTAVKDDKYRSGLSFNGFKGMWNDLVESMSLSNKRQNKMGLASDRFQTFSGHSLSAREGSAIIRKLQMKKLINPAGADLLKKRLRASIPDVIWELAPYFAIFLMWTIIKKNLIEPIEDMKDDDGKRKGKH